MFKLAIKESLDRKFKRFQTKDKEMLRLIEKKVNDILVDPYRFKPLRKLYYPVRLGTLIQIGSPVLPNALRSLLFHNSYPSFQYSILSVFYSSPISLFHYIYIIAWSNYGLVRS